MKVIDLLNKIANGEEVPKKIKYQFKTFELNEDNRYIRTDKVSQYDYGNKTLLEYVLECDLHYEVEIIEEDKEIEKLPQWATKIDNSVEHTTQEHFNWICANKINELIDEVNTLKGGKNDC